VNQLLALDWGTSSLRGALIAADGSVLDERAFARGILSVEKGGFPTVFQSCFGDWMAQAGLCLISGMAGSQQGWLEAPYCPCPAGLDEIAGQLTWVEPGRIAIVPGLCTVEAGVPDVMRGEETQVLGALDLLALNDARMVLPGTHSKWVDVTGRRITRFATFMTGEFYALLRQHSILARTLPGDEPAADEQAFAQGVNQSLQGEGLLHNAFSTRTLALFKLMDGAQLHSYLSGLLIGEELRSQSLQAGETIQVMGADALSARYVQALLMRGIKAQRVDAAAIWRGLQAIAATLTPA
jgi:2-dehydro-3-deoxygalactonokinase